MEESPSHIESESATQKTDSENVSKERKYLHEQDYLLTLIEREHEIMELIEKLNDRDIEIARLKERNSNLESANIFLNQQVKNSQSLLSSFAISRQDIPADAPSSSAAPDSPVFNPNADDETTVPQGTAPVIRRHKNRPISKDLINKLKNDRRSYAAVCDAALRYWQCLCDAGFVDENLKLKPYCGITVAARIACRFQTVVDPGITWTFFHRHWNVNHLQSQLHHEAYKDLEKYKTENVIFGLPPDAPYLSKSAVNI